MLNVQGGGGFIRAIGCWIHPLILLGISQAQENPSFVCTLATTHPLPWYQYQDLLSVMMYFGWLVEKSDAFCEWLAGKWLKTGIP